MNKQNNNYNLLIHKININNYKNNLYKCNSKTKSNNKLFLNLKMKKHNKDKVLMINKNRIDKIEIRTVKSKIIILKVLI